MMDVADLIVRGGTIFDGMGGAPFEADLAIKDERIAAVGRCDGPAAEVIDAKGMIVTPGFVDIHTHYDGQLIWSPLLSPSSSHGVTSVVTGNCGVGFAPCRPADHTRLIKLLEGVEDMPEVVLADGLTWEWKSFPEFIAALNQRVHDIDFGVQLPHAALRMYVIGERAADGAIATEEEIGQMRQLAREAVEAGALGFGTSRSIFHTSPDGTVIPTAHAPELELRAIAQGMQDAGGVIQAMLNVQEPGPDLEMFCRISGETGCPFSFTLLQVLGTKPDRWRELLELTQRANCQGIRVTAQVLPRPVSVLLGLDASYHPFAAHPAYLRIAHLPLPERVAQMRKPEVRAAILADKPEPRRIAFYYTARLFDTIYRLGATPNYEPSPADSIAAQAAARRISPDALAYDLLLQDEGRALLLQTIANYVEGNLEAVRAMLTAPHTVPALGDGGAHYGMICDASYTTFLLAYWGRDRASGRIGLPQIVRSLTATPAEVMGLKDRGRIAIGLKADLNVIDFDRLNLHAPRTVHDLPSGGRRLTQNADGYVATIVSGRVIRRDDQPTGILPGRMIRRAGG